MLQTISLGGKDWQLKGTAPYVPLRENSMETGKPLEGITSWMEAEAPGGVTLALYRAGHIQHPYVGMNSLACEWAESRWWIYRKSFGRPAMPSKRVLLRFHGVDYTCMVYLNGKLLGEHEGMFESFSFDITDQYRDAESFVLEVLILNVPSEMGQIGRTSLTSTQKARFGYKWDFGTHLVNLGIWQDVELVLEDAAILDDMSVTTDVLADGAGAMAVTGAVREHQPLEQATVKVLCTREGRPCGEASGQPDADGRFAIDLRVENPELWYPNGMGAQPLYDITVRLEARDTLDEKRYHLGIRHVEYCQNEGGPEDALPYTLRVNGRRMLIKGVNMPPMDHIYGDIPEEQVDFQLQRAVEMNVNMVRVWGGGLIETERFYDACDRLGLLVWQEFIQSSSGIDNIPSELPGFLVLLEKAARCALAQKRNHTALVIWGGGNELMDAQRIPQTMDNPNLRMLAGLVREMDPTRLYLPASPSGPSKWINPQPGLSHDVHGWWQYQGNPEHYRFYASSDSLLHSEFGCDGMSSMQTVARILPQVPAAPRRMHDDDLWRFHGDWWCTYDREMRMFGPVPELSRYVMLSQWMQAEGLRYILEANRRRMWRCSGSLIWQFNEPWPNLSCTSLMDYYGHPKMAYYAARDAFSSFHVFFTYPRLDYAPGELVEGDLYLAADGAVPAGEAALDIEAMDLRGKLLYREERRVQVEPDRACVAGRLSFAAPDVDDDVFILRLRASMGEWVARNAYCFSNSATEPYAAIAALHGAQLVAHAASTGERSAAITVRNTGERAALGVFIQDRLDEWNLSVDRQYETLLPGESFTMRVSWSKRFRFGFDEYASIQSDAPKLEIMGIGLDAPLEVGVDEE